MIVVSLNQERIPTLFKVPNDYKLCMYLGRYFPHQESDAISDRLLGEERKYISHLAKAQKLDETDIAIETKRLLTTPEAYVLHRRAKYLNNMEAASITVANLKAILNTLNDDDLITIRSQDFNGSPIFTQFSRPTRDNGVFFFDAPFQNH